jgi:hypothetical protein
MNLEQMTEQERENLIVDVFKWVQTRGGRLPLAAYWERLRTFPTVYHESVEFCPSDDGRSWEVLMDQRPSDDPFFPNRFGSQGFTVLNREVLSGLIERHEKQELDGGGVSNAPEFRFCGIGVTPLTRRDHAYIVIFARLWPAKPQIIGSEYRSKWVPVSNLDGYDVIPSCSMYIKIAADVMIGGAMPHYREFLGEF